MNPKVRGWEIKKDERRNEQNKKQNVEKINERINNIDKALARLIRKKRYQLSISGMRDVISLQILQLLKA